MDDLVDLDSQRYRSSRRVILDLGEGIMSESEPQAAGEIGMADGDGREPRPHFGRDMFVLLALTMAGFVGIVWSFHRASIQHEIVDRIREAGGDVTYDWQMVDGRVVAGKSPPWWTLLMAAFPFSPDYFTKVVEVDLAGAKDIQSGLTAALELAELRALRLDDSDLTGESLRKLPSLKRLEKLSLAGVAVADADLVHLADMKPLRTLGLSRTTITDAGLANLQGLPWLEQLDLGQTRVSDPGMNVLAGITTLTRLTLDNASVTDEGLKHLADLDSLQSVSVKYTRITEAGVMTLKRKRPGIRVVTEEVSE
jgi:hypothetical protein